MRNVLVRRPGHIQPTQKGTAAVEFAIVGGWLIMLLGVIVEVGAFLLIQFELQHAADRAARLIRTNQVTTTTTASSFKNSICASISVDDCIGKVFIDVRNATSFADLAKVMPVQSGKAPEVGPEVANETFETGAPGDMGSLILTYDWQFIFPFMNVFSNQPGQVRRLYGISVFRRET